MNDPLLRNKAKHLNENPLRLKFMKKLSNLIIFKWFPWIKIYGLPQWEIFLASAQNFPKNKHFWPSDTHEILNIISATTLRKKLQIKETWNHVDNRINFQKTSRVYVTYTNLKTTFKNVFGLDSEFNSWKDSLIQNKLNT